MKINPTWANTKLYSPYANAIKKSEKFNNLNVSENKTSKSLLSTGVFRIPQIDGTHISNINQYMSEIHQLLRDSGISLDGKCSVTIGMDGDLVVNGSIEDKEKLEGILSDNKELAENLRNEIIMLEHAEKIKKSMAFNKAYAQNPNAAVSQYWQLFNNSYNTQVIMEIGQDSFSIQVKESHNPKLNNH